MKTPRDRHIVKRKRSWGPDMPKEGYTPPDGQLRLPFLDLGLPCGLSDGDDAGCHPVWHSGVNQYCDGSDSGEVGAAGSATPDEPAGLSGQGDECDV